MIEKNPDYKRRFNNYIRQVSSGKKDSCLMERLAVERHLKDLKRLKGYRFDLDLGVKYCNFFNLLRHFKGEMAGQQFILEHWQVFTVCSIFGWVHNRTGYRRFRYADVIIPRKNGKSTFAAGIALAMMCIDGEMGAEIFSAGTDSDQARVVFETAKELVRNSPLLSKILKTFAHSIVFEKTVSSFKPLSKEISNKDGSNPHCAICDERHAWKTNELFEVLKSGTGARRQSLILTITTAGRDLSLPYFKQTNYLCDLLRGKVKQNNQFALIFTPDEGDDWTSPQVWRKVNPSYGKALRPEYIRQECDEAIKKGGTTETNFKTKNLNLWVDAPDVWIKDEFVAACNYNTSKEDLEGCTCFAGLDIASHVDFNALALWFPEEQYKPVIMHYWLPKSKIYDPAQKDGVNYSQWHQGGWIHEMQGNVLDVDAMSADIAEIIRRYNCKRLAFDPYKAYHGVIQNLTNDGLSEILAEYSQGIRNMSEPTKKLESMIVGAEIDLRGDPVLRWMLGNVAIYEDANENVKIHKSKSSNKVDGVVALINAIGGWMAFVADEQKDRIYENYTLRTINLGL